MFIEMTEEAWAKLKEKMDSKGYKYEVSDCTMQSDSQKHIHIEFGDLGVEHIKEFAAYADEAYGLVADISKEEEKAKKLKDAEDLDTPKREVRREWDDKYHGVVGEAAGFVSGKNVEETER